MKKVTALLSAALVPLILAACALAPGQESPAGTGAQTDTDHVVLRLANSHNAQHITSQACQMFADLVAERTDGRITIECHFDGELGDERSTIEQCQFGGVDFTRVSSGVSAEFAPLMNALQMPYEYTDVDHLFRVLDGEIGQEVFDTFRDNGLVGITYLHPGFRCFFNARKEIRTPRRHFRYEDPGFRVRSDAQHDGMPGSYRCGPALQQHLFRHPDRHGGRCREQHDLLYRDVLLGGGSLLDL